VSQCPLLPWKCFVVSQGKKRERESGRPDHVLVGEARKRVLIGV
jgi:hypothetical protein